MKRSTWSSLALTAMAAAAALAVGACTTGQPRAARIEGAWVEPDTSGRVIYLQPVQPTARTVISKNYAVGSRRVAAVGEPMVGVRDYTSSDLVVAAIAARDFVQHCRTADDLELEEVAEEPAEPVVDPRATAEVPSGGFEHEPEAYDLGATQEAPLPSTPDTQISEPAAAEGERRSLGSRATAPFRRLFGGREDEAAAAEVPYGGPTREEESDLAEPLTPPTAARVSDEGQPEVEAPDAVVPEGPVDPLACQSGRLSFVRGERGERFVVSGAFEEGGKQYYLVDIPTIGGNVFVAVDARGRLKSEPYLAWRDVNDDVTTRFGVPLEYLKVPVPMQSDERLFRFETTETVAVHGGAYRNFELVFKGTTYDHRGMVYHMLYKEYGRDRPNSPIFIQDLAYASQTNTVDILGMRIRVHDVNDSQIIYTVQRD